MIIDMIVIMKNLFFMMFIKLLFLIRLLYNNLLMIQINDYRLLAFGLLGNRIWKNILNGLFFVIAMFAIITCRNKSEMILQ